MNKKKIALMASFIIFGLLLTVVKFDYNKVLAQQVGKYMTFQVIGNLNETGGIRFVRQVNNQESPHKFNFGWTQAGDPAFGIGDSILYDSVNSAGKPGFFTYAVDPNSKDRYSTISLYAPTTDADGGNGRIEFRQRVPLAPYISYLPAFGQTPPSGPCAGPDCLKQLTTKEYVDNKAGGSKAGRKYSGLIVVDLDNELQKSTVPGTRFRYDGVTADKLCQIKKYDYSLFIYPTHFSSCGNNAVKWWDPKKERWEVWGACQYNSGIYYLQCYSLTTTPPEEAGSPFASIPYPVINVNPTSISFGNVMAGQTSGEQKVMVKNRGGVELKIATAVLAGDSPRQFEITTDKCSGVTLASVGDCQIMVVFSPGAKTKTGVKNATLVISSNDPNSPTANVDLTGTACKPGQLPGALPTCQ